MMKKNKKIFAKLPEIDMVFFGLEKACLNDQLDFKGQLAKFKNDLIYRPQHKAIISGKPANHNVSTYKHGPWV